MVHVQVLFVLLQPHHDDDRRRRPPVAASVQILIEGHPMVQQYLVRAPSPFLISLFLFGRDPKRFNISQASACGCALGLMQIVADKPAPLLACMPTLFL